MHIKETGALGNQFVCVVGIFLTSERIFTMDGLSGYNQVALEKKD